MLSVYNNKFPKHIFQIFCQNFCQNFGHAELNWTENEMGEFYQIQSEVSIIHGQVYILYIILVTTYLTYLHLCYFIVLLFIFYKMWKIVKEFKLFSNFLTGMGLSNR